LSLTVVLVETGPVGLLLMLIADVPPQSLVCPLSTPHAPGVSA